jgi:type IV secretory pathway TraG/TraD family ATPase VirD4
MNALQNGLNSVSAGGSPGWASDDSPLLLLSPEDRLTLRQSFEGMFVTGQTGSGKTSGPGQAAAVALLRSGAGGLFTTTRPDDARTYMTWARLAGREKDVRVFNPQQKWRLSLLDYCYRQAGSRGAGDTDNVVALINELLEFKNRGRESGGENQFWYSYAAKFLAHVIDLLACAGEAVSFGGINKVLQSTPRSLEEVRSSDWQEKSFANQLVDRAVANKKLSTVQQTDLPLALEFILSILPRMDERLRSGIIATLDSVTYPFQRGQLAALCGGEQTNLTPEDTFRGAIVILDLPIKEYHQTGIFVQVLFARLWQQAAERRDLKLFPRPLFFFSDEAQNFLTRQSPLFASTARGARVASVLLTQNLDALQAQIGKADSEALLGNCNLKIWCSNDHVPTNEWSAKTVGQLWGVTGNTNVSLGAGGAAGAGGGASGGVSEQLRYQIEPSEFVRLRKGGVENDCQVEAIAFRSGRPFRASRANFMRVFFPQNIGAPVRA